MMLLNTISIIGITRLRCTNKPQYLTRLFSVSIYSSNSIYRLDRSCDSLARFITDERYEHKFVHCASLMSKKWLCGRRSSNIRGQCLLVGKTFSGKYTSLLPRIEAGLQATNKLDHIAGYLLSLLIRR